MSSQDKKPLRQVAADKVNGPNANPSQLGDPISLKAETNQNPPDNVEYAPEGAEVSPSPSTRSPSNKSPSASKANRTKAYGVPRNDPTDASSGGARTASGKRIPLEGDPTSLEREQVVDDTKGKGRGRRGSKL
ncbi:uncharacterized protein B0T23DRAFT_450227 [Neurospora hispaniola]|uniref:Uncharacterized protein n=1 Tax=Neurospora hispaniola TaxID=588809 RepID=A0AAJ0IFW9_9PEZI|nr:hypothetical protein B0T23DRAFT_450227 [Neurospora hispaniola]